MKNTSFVPSSVPSLSSFPNNLLSFYGGVENKTLFKKVFRAVYRYFFPLRAFDTFSFSFIIYEGLWRKYDLSRQYTFLFIKLIALSRGGIDTLDTRFLKLDNWENRGIQIFVNRGFLTRSFFHPLHPYEKKFRTNTYVFLTFTESGIKFYSDIVRDVNSHVLRYFRDLAEYSANKYH